LSVFSFLICNFTLFLGSFASVILHDWLWKKNDRNHNVSGWKHISIWKESRMCSRIESECKNPVKRNFLHHWTFDNLLQHVHLTILISAIALHGSNGISRTKSNCRSSISLLLSFDSHFLHPKIYDRLKGKLIKKGKHLRKMPRSIYWIIIIRFAGEGFMRNMSRRTRCRENGERSIPIHQFMACLSCCFCLVGGLSAPSFSIIFLSTQKGLFHF
jgi:hypothetical protein